MQVRVSCHTSQLESYVEYYESSGFSLLQKSIEGEDVILIFQGQSTAHVAEASYWDSSAQAFIQFQDGTTSPLYVRRSRWMED
jgi:hypothetical protein